MIVQLPTDAEAALLACSGLALPPGAALRPLGPKGWSTLRQGATEAGVQPGDLVELGDRDLEERLHLGPELSSRLAGLFARRGQLAMELERHSRLGIWLTTLDDGRYPRLVAERLGDLAPPVLFGLGDHALLERHGLAVVGSREADPAVLEVAQRAGEEAARQAWVVVSGAARGVDTAAMRGAFEAGGAVVGVPADGLERHLRDATIRSAAIEGRVVHPSTYRPDATFSVGAAMGRNKLIHCLARVAFIVHASAGTGGTWAGAVEAIENGWLPTYVLDGDAAPRGTVELVKQGARPLAVAGLGDLEGLIAGPDERVDAIPEKEAVQQTLF